MGPRSAATLLLAGLEYSSRHIREAALTRQFTACQTVLDHLRVLLEIVFRLRGRVHQVREVCCIVVQILTILAVLLLCYGISFVVEILIRQLSAAVLEQEVV